MKVLHRHKLSLTIHALTTALVAGAWAMPVLAQGDRSGDDTTKLEAVEVTGSRIKKAELEGQTPVVTISAKDIEATGLGSIGDVIQRLSVSSSSLNTKFNSAGNFGFPADGGGVGSGSTTISLRNLGAKRTLVLVDGLRWVNETSGSGVSAAVDLNTIPASAVDRIEILTDGASSLYGSDAISGVINIITKRKQEGMSVGAYYGNYSIGDGETTTGNISLGGSTDRLDFFLDISHFKQHRISSGDWDQSSFPTPGAGLAGGSSYIPYTRTIFFPDDPTNTYGGLCPRPVDAQGNPTGPARCNIAANGTTNGVQPFPGGFHRFTNADRFNFAPYNLLLTPNERDGLFGQARYKVTDNITWYLKGSYTTRKSVNQAAPEPIGLGSALNTSDLGLVTGVHVTNPYNPFGVTLDPNSNFAGLGRRPVEGGPRVFTQDVDTKYFATGLEGSFTAGDRDFYWDANYVDSTNKGTQTVRGTYNIAHIAKALGPLAACQADPQCVPLNIFGGPGSITPEMLNYISFIEKDTSENILEMLTANLSGDLFDLPAGSLAFATGYEHRRQEGSYTPDAIVVAGEGNGVPSLPTSGDYSVDEYYLELNIPLLKDLAVAKSLELSVASRYSDYSTFGGTTNNKLGVRWQVNDDLTLRGTWAEGFRAPSIGELYGAPARFDASISDPCNGATGQAAANCIAQGVPDPANFEQANPQISTRTGGSLDLEPETSDSITAGLVYSPSWAHDTGWSSKLDLELTYWKIKLEDAIQAPDAQTQLDRCVATNSPTFCSGIVRGSSGDIVSFNNTLRNLGRIDTRGYDIGVNWTSPEWSWGTWTAGLATTYTDEYESVATDTGLAEPLTVGVETTDRAIPEWRTTATLGWAVESFSARWTSRYVSSLTESCNPDLTEVGAVCSNPNADLSGGTNHLGGTTFHDVRVNWKLPVDFDFTLSAGVNNLFAKDPPICVSCSLNGYDASTYDLPGRFSYISANLKF
ncbi:TonB-dependent receptor [Tahibacter amnicola]|uniref:TonB-dependent receptor n=1 Tax=Tahibacter amnicola TaxID=2976241 RepID=A0ABY6BF53_9GAMM|nr:TonB-dependent receptor [Tahibacter amnicola]UXI68221.1 TonB-dependent receptor [Tahibacter amnicola]